MAFIFQRPSVFGPPYLRGAWSVDRTAFAFLLCLLPPFGVTVYERGLPFLAATILSIAVVVGWQLVFSVVRKRQIGWDGIGTAITFALLVGGDVPFWQIALAVTFGVVVGEQIFGGRGFSFLNPAVVALAFLTFSFTGAGFAEPVPWFAVATLPSFVFLVAARLISWRMILGIIAGLVSIGLLRGQSLQLELLSGSFIFIIAFLACDPTCSAATNLGRWANGILISGLAWVFTSDGGISTGPEALVSAVLLASVFAPLIDTLVVLINNYERGRSDV